MDVHNGFWYFAHPYTVKDTAGQYVSAAEEANFRLCCIRAGELLQRGYNIYAPICHTHPIHMHSPTFLSNHEHELWYELDVDFLERCSFDGIVLAPGWSDSKGCVAEERWFRTRGIPVAFYQDIVNGLAVSGPLASRRKG